MHPQDLNKTQTLFARIMKYARSPRFYLRRLYKLSLWKLSDLLGDAPFYLHSQMDINPKSYWFNTDFAARNGGFFPPNDTGGRTISKFPAWDNVRRDMLILLLRRVLAEGVPGNFAEVGVYKGLTARLIHHYAPERVLYLFDTFQGFTERSVSRELAATGHLVSAAHFSDTSIEAVRAFIQPQNNNVRFIQGYFPDSARNVLKGEMFAFVHLDADLYEPTYSGLEFFFPKLSYNGMIVVHDYNAWPGARRAVDDFMKGRRDPLIPMPDKSGSALIVRVTD